MESPKLVLNLGNVPVITRRYSSYYISNVHKQIWPNEIPTGAENWMGKCRFEKFQRAVRVDSAEKRKQGAIFLDIVRVLDRASFRSDVKSAVYLDLEQIFILDQLLQRFGASGIGACGQIRRHEAKMRTLEQILQGG